MSCTCQVRSHLKKSHKELHSVWRRRWRRRRRRRRKQDLLSHYASSQVSPPNHLIYRVKIYFLTTLYLFGLLRKPPFYEKKIIFDNSKKVSKKKGGLHVSIRFKGYSSKRNQYPVSQKQKQTKTKARNNFSFSLLGLIVHVIKLFCTIVFVPMCDEG